MQGVSLQEVDRGRFDQAQVDRRPGTGKQGLGEAGGPRHQFLELLACWNNITSVNDKRFVNISALETNSEATAALGS